MKIVLPIKHVPALDSARIDEKTKRMVRDGVESMVNALDLHAIGGALALKEKVGGEVSVVCMGVASGIDTIREAIATGCDKGYLVSDAAFAGADSIATATVLATAIKKIGADLIICGDKSTDGGSGHVGPALAAFLGMPVVTAVTGATVEGNTATVTRLIESGTEVYRVELPVVLCILKDFSDTRYPSLKGKMAAKKAQIPTWTKADLSIEAKPATEVVSVVKPNLSRVTEKIKAETDDEIAAACAKAVDYLEKNRLL